MPIHHASGDPPIRWGRTFFESWRVFSAQLGVMIPIALATAVLLNVISVLLKTIATADKHFWLPAYYLFILLRRVMFIGDIAIARAADAFKASGTRLCLGESLRWSWKRWRAINWKAFARRNRVLSLFAILLIVAWVVFEKAPFIQLAIFVGYVFISFRYSLRWCFGFLAVALREVQGEQAIDHARNVYRLAPAGTFFLYLFWELSPWVYGFLLELPVLLLGPPLSTMVEWVAAPFVGILSALILVMQAILFIELDRRLPMRALAAAAEETVGRSGPGI